MNYLPRDFIETPEGLVFAVVDPVPEQGKILCFLRYVPDHSGTRLRKLDTDAANEYLRLHHPGYLHHSVRFDARLHAVAEVLVQHHHRPRARLQALLHGGGSDALEAKARRLVEQFALRGLDLHELGVTGSLLICAQTASSDIDLVAYGRHAFFAARDIIRSGITEGLFAELDPAAWREAYLRRGCALALDEFVWHERRKANKALFEGTKFDLTQVGIEPAEASATWRKLGATTLRAVVLDAMAAFDSPAKYRIDHADIAEILVFTHTYVGQARRGETIEASGQVEQGPGKRLRLVVGASREAPGEYVRVLRSGPGGAAIPGVRGPGDASGEIWS